MKTTNFILFSFVFVYNFMFCANNDHISEKRQQVMITDPFMEMPEAIYEPEIKYPDELEDTKQEVTVYVAARIDADGNVNDVKIVKSTNLKFNKYAIDYAYQYRFKPGKKDGQKIEMHVAWPIIFENNF